MSVTHASDASAVTLASGLANLPLDRGQATPMPEGGVNLILILCIVLLGAAIFAVRRRADMPASQWRGLRLGLAKRSGQPGDALEIASSRRLDAWTHLHVVRFGDHTLLIASTPQGASVLQTQPTEAPAREPQ